MNFLQHLARLVAQAIVNNCVRLPLPIVRAHVVPEAELGRVQLGDYGASVNDLFHLLFLPLNMVR